MFEIPSLVKALAALAITAILAFGLWHISGLKADLAVSEANVQKLKDAIEGQKAAIAQIKEDQAKINQINVDLNMQVKLQEKDIKDLRDRFNTSANGQKRDFGKVASSKPGLVENIVNTATKNAARCLEIASGSPLTESEKNATKVTEINKECPSIANPNYKATK